jgi:hypothetical protein
MRAFFFYLKMLGVVLLMDVITSLFIRPLSDLLTNVFVLMIIPIILSVWIIIDLIKEIYYLIRPKKHPDNIKIQKEEEKKRQSEAAKQERIAEAGRIGEEQVKAEFSKIPNTIVLSNLYVPVNNENTKHTEVDIVVLNKVGIYVIEVKNYTGVIKGDKDAKNWIRTNKDTVKEFYNPLMQNEAHIEALIRYVGRFSSRVKCLIVFGDKADISAVKYTDYDRRIINTSDVRKTMATDIYGAPSKLTTEELEYIKTELQKCVDVSDDIKKEHLEYVKNKHKEELE